MEFNELFNHVELSKSKTLLEQERLFLINGSDEKKLDKFDSFFKRMLEYKKLLQIYNNTQPLTTEEIKIIRKENYKKYHTLHNGKYRMINAMLKDEDRNISLYRYLRSEFKESL